MSIKSKILNFSFFRLNFFYRIDSWSFAHHLKLIKFNGNNQKKERIIIALQRRAEEEEVSDEFQLQSIFLNVSNLLGKTSNDFWLRVEELLDWKKNSNEVYQKYVYFSSASICVTKTKIESMTSRTKVWFHF